MAKTVCPITRDAFLSGNDTLSVVIDGTEYALQRREFSTGSFGWYLPGKQSVTINGQAVTVQLGINITVVGSKEMPRAAAPAPTAQAPAPAPVAPAASTAPVVIRRPRGAKKA